MGKLFSKIVSLLLGVLLGAPACWWESAEYGPPVVEYGVPHARYHVSGKVQNTLTNPIPGIQVGFADTTVLTTDGGSFTIDHHAFPCDEACSLELTDIDGTDNGGEYSDTTVPLTLTQSEEGSGSWDQGTFVQTGIVITLDEK